MTTGRINQVTIFVPKGRPDGQPRPPNPHRGRKSLHRKGRGPRPTPNPHAGHPVKGGRVTVIQLPPLSSPRRGPPQSPRRPYRQPRDCGIHPSRGGHQPPVTSIPENGDRRLPVTAYPQKSGEKWSPRANHPQTSSSPDSMCRPDFSCPHVHTSRPSSWPVMIRVRHKTPPSTGASEDHSAHG